MGTLLKDKNKLAWLLITLGVLLLPFVFGKGFYLNTMNFIALHSMVAVGLCLLVGYGGQLSISHSAFFAIGAYASAIFCLRHHLPPLISILLSQGLSALLAWGIGWVVLRLKGHYLAIATLSFTIIVEVLVKEMAWLTGGLQGLSSIPSISIGGFVIDSDYRFYFVVWPLTMLLLLFSLNLVDSRMGRIFRAIKENEEIARQFGADVKVYKIKLFIVSSVYASIAGSLYAHFVTFISPVTGSIMFAIDIIMVLAFGGFTLLWGAMIGVASLTFLNEYLTIFADYKRAIYGLALVIIILFFPNGLLLGLRDFGNRILLLITKGSKKHASA
jgi:branched-chain amino acid transport system permease protein